MEFDPIVGKTYFGVLWKETGEIEYCLNRKEAEQITSEYPDTEVVKWYLVGK